MWYLLYKTTTLWSRSEHLAVLSAALIMVLAGCFFATNAYYAKTHEVPSQGGAYTEGMVGQPITINPILANNNEIDEALIQLLFTSLGELAESSTISPDKKTWIITLKKDVVWDDGAPLTANDVVFTVETIQDQNTRSPRALAWNAVVVEKINDREIRFTLKTPYVFFKNIWEELIIAPQHIFGTIPSANLRLSRYNLEPVGNGPYRLQKIITEKDGFITALILTANNRYHAEAPLIHSFTVKLYRTEQMLIEDFNVKKIDGVGGLNPERVKSLTINHELKVLRMPRYYAIFINQNTHPALKEKAVRQKLEKAVNRTEIIKTIFKGYAEAVEGPLTSLTPGFIHKESVSAENMKQESAEELEKAGWLINPEDNIRYKTIAKNRIKLSFSIVTPDIPFLIQTMEQIKQAWTPLGIEIKLIVMNPEDIAESSIKTRNYDMLIFGNSLPRYPDIFSFWHSSQKFYPGLNLSLYDNKAVDALLESLRITHQNEEQKEMTEKIQIIIREEVPAIFLYNPSYLYATSPNLKGFTNEIVQTASSRFTHVNKWYLKTKRVFDIL